MPEDISALYCLCLVLIRAVDVPGLLTMLFPITSGQCCVSSSPLDGLCATNSVCNVCVCYARCHATGTTPFSPWACWSCLSARW